MHLVRRSVAEALVLAVELFPYTNFVHPGSRRGPQNFTSNKLTNKLTLGYFPKM